MAKKAKIVEAGMTAHLFAVNLLEKIVEYLRGIMTSNLLEFCKKWIYMIGHFGIIVAAGLGFLFTLVYVIRINKFDVFLYGIAWVLLMFVAQYTAHKFSAAGEILIKNNPTQQSSKIFLDCLAFLLVIGGIVVLIINIVLAIRIGRIEPFLTGLGAFIFFELMALISFNPKTINIDIVESNSAGQEAIGIITFFIKGFMKLVPIFFGIGVIIGTVILFINIFGLFGSNFLSAWVRGRESAMQIFSAALLPFLSYIFFVLFYLAIDIVRAILSIPGKLDK